MRVGFDAKRAFCNNTGLGNYSRGVIKNMCVYYPEHTYFLYTPPPQTNLCTKIIAKKCVRVRKPKKAFNKASPLWRSFALGKELSQDKIDIYHGLSNELPVQKRPNRIKTVVTIHDLIFLRYPGYYKPLDRQVYKLKCKYACQHADRIVAVSKQTKDDLVNYLGVAPEKIEVIYQTCADIFYEPLEHAKRQKILQELALPDDFLLHVGSITRRKNLLGIAKALALLKEDQQAFPPLVVVGQGKSDYTAEVLDFLKQNRLKEKVIWRDKLHVRDLACLFQQAKLFLYPSQFEGFGIPIIESLFSKTPVIASKGSCFSEAGGPNTWYVDPNDPQEIATGISRILASPNLQEDMAKQGHDFVQRFHKQRVTKDLMQLYLSLR